MTDLSPAYSHLHAMAACMPLHDLSFIRVTGSDRATLLHNLCTNEIRTLPQGKACEAFFLSVQGKIVGHGNILALADSHLIVSSANQAPALLPQLDRYIIREEVQLQDQSAALTAIVVAGPLAENVLNRINLGPGPQRLHEVTTAQLDQEPLVIVRTSWLSVPTFVVILHPAAEPLLHGLLLRTPADQDAAVKVIDCPREVFEMARIENGWPWYGIDITSDNLPQEVARDAQAISFVKGCYLGQETVARIDALGHANWILRGLSCDAPGRLVAQSELRLDDKVVARVRSATHSEKLDMSLALAYVRTGFASDQTTFSIDSAKFTVHALPLSERRSCSA